MIKRGGEDILSHKTLIGEYKRSVIIKKRSYRGAKPLF